MRFFSYLFGVAAVVSSIAAQDIAIAPQRSNDPRIQNERYKLRTAKAARRVGARTAAPVPTQVGERERTLSPKIFIIGMIGAETQVWLDNYPGLGKNRVEVVGLSSQFPYVDCTPNGDVCTITTAPGEINAAASLQALWLSPRFDLRKTYWLVGGIGGINPAFGTTGSVTFPRYAIQFDLQFEFDAREIEQNYTSGYVPLFNNKPSFYDPSIPAEDPRSAYPRSIYGTELFRLNEQLMTRFFTLAQGVEKRLNDSAPAQSYRSKYGSTPGGQPPNVVQCDTGTANIYWSGALLADAFSNYTLLLTNGTGKYCMTQQEDNATLESLLRGHAAGKVDYSRIAILRTGSDFDRAPPGTSETQHLLFEQQGGTQIAFQNIYIAGREIVGDVLGKWEEVYGKGVKSEKAIGSILGDVER